MTKNIDKNSNNLHVNIEVVNIPVFSSEDYVRSSFSKENASDFLEIYNKITNSLLNKKITANNSFLSGNELKNSLVFIIKFLVKLIKFIYLINNKASRIYYKFKRLLSFFRINLSRSKKF